LDGRLDVGIGRAALAPPGVASRLFRQDPLGVLVPDGHRFASLNGVPVATLAEEPLLLAEDAQAPEFNQFVVEMCRAAGFTPAVLQFVVSIRRPWRLADRMNIDEGPARARQNPKAVAVVLAGTITSVLAAWRRITRRGSRR